MAPLIECPDLDRMLVRLTKEEIKAPITIVEDYCDEYKVGQVRDSFSQVVKIALMKDDRYNIIDIRAALIEWAEQTDKVLESLYAVMTILKNKPHLLKELSL